MTESEPEEVKRYLTREDARRLAEKCRGKLDPFPVEIAPSLMSAEHIEKYVLATGLIGPFDAREDGGGRSRLKKASYEGRIGKAAYMYDDGGNLVSLLIPNQPLVIPANSIVFVECDLDFRLPQYIALRFNLQIRLVHRGLLLGTGPLVDPLYWGKLCIPLHNLTDADLSIPLDQGLIWIEFTKTTSDHKTGVAALKSGKEHWEIVEFLDEASKRFAVDSEKTPIRSSIPVLAKQAVTASEEAVESSQDALNHASKASGRAKDAESAVEQVSTFIRRIAIAAALAVIIAIAGLWLAFYDVTVGRIDSANKRIDALVERNDTAQESPGNGELPQETNEDSLRPNEGTAELSAELEALKAQFELLRRDANSPPPGDK